MSSETRIYLQELKFDLYYSLEESPADEVEKVLGLIEKVKQTKKIKFNIITDITENEYNKLKR